MKQLDLFAGAEPVALTVTALTTHIRNLFEADDLLADVWVEGEVSNYSRPASGHLYFSLKDETAQIRCVMWKTRAAQLRSMPGNGQSVRAHGSVGVYPANGSYQLYVDRIEDAGLGTLYVQFERLKKRLAEEGLFDAERKRPLPPFPHVIGLVTSPTGAAIRDILSILERRFPLATVMLAPAQVQGDAAPAQIVASLDRLNRQGLADVIIVARGGGSLEELWAFNDEQVARAIRSSRIPVVTGVGHETDFTIADFCADVRAPTPSAAAELVSPDQLDLRAQVAELSGRLARAWTSSAASWRADLTRETRLLARLSPSAVIAGRRQAVDELTTRLERGVAHLRQGQRARLSELGARLSALSPFATLERGYAIVSRERDHRVVRSLADVVAGDRLRTRLSDGTFSSRVESEQVRDTIEAPATTGDGQG